MAITREGTAPYAPASAILEVIDRRRNRGLTTPVTADVLERAGIQASLIPRTLQALRTLDLIDETGAPTRAFEGIKLASEADCKKSLEDWLKGAYAEIFSYVDPMTDDETRIRDAFRGFEPDGQRNRMVTLFLGLCRAAGLVPEATSTPRPQVSRPRPAAARMATRIAASKPATKPSLKMATGLPPALSGLLEDLPTPPDGWTATERDKFLTTFKTILEYYIPVVREDQKKAAVTE